MTVGASISGLRQLLTVMPQTEPTEWAHRRRRPGQTAAEDTAGPGPAGRGRRRRRGQAKQAKMFGALTWRNLMVRKHTVCMSMAEVLAASGVFLLMCMVYRRPPVAELDTEPEPPLFPGLKARVAFCPQTDFTKAVMAVFEQIHNSTEVLGKDTEQQLVDLHKLHGNVFGVVFHSTSPQTVIEYTVRSPIQYHTKITWVTDYRTIRTPPGKKSMYKNMPIVFVKAGVDAAVISVMSRTMPAAHLTFGRALPATEQSGRAAFKMVMMTTLTGTFCYSFLLMAVGLMKRVIVERENGVKMLLKLMGLRSVTLWLSWLLHAAIMAAIIAAINTVIFKIDFMRCDGAILWLTLTLYGCAAVALLFVVTAFMKSPMVSLMTGMSLWIVGNIIGEALAQRQPSYAQQLFASLVPNVALYMGMLAIYDYEFKEHPFGWNDLASGDPENMSMLAVWLVLIADTGLFLCLTLYLDPMFPGKYGSPQPWLWPCRRQREGVKPEPVVAEEAAAAAVAAAAAAAEAAAGALSGPGSLGRGGRRGSGGGEEPPMVEPPEPGMQVGIRLLGVSKTYHVGKRRVNALSSVSLDVYRGTITVLLGHNGAGKTTAISLIAGMQQPSKGLVWVEGCSTRTAMHRLQGKLALCMQENVFVHSLTVREHLTFVSKMKRMQGPEQQRSVGQVAEQLGLRPYMNRTPQQLSGGYKRRLCLAVALIGDSKVVVLDEPTSGLDPEARRDIWNVVLGLRENRTTLITTQFMEEADVLGDRIIILSDGQVRCYGTPNFLRREYNSGYLLALQKQRDRAAGDISAAVLAAVPRAEKKTETPTYLTYSLPVADSDRFEGLFAELERERERLGIVTIGLSVSSIEDIFFKSNKFEEDSSELLSVVNEAPAVYRMGCPLLKKQERALFIKEVVHTGRNWRALLFQGLFIVASVLLAQLLTLQTPGETQAGRPMRLSSYGPSTLLWSRGPAVSPPLVDALLAAAREEAAEPEEVGSPEEIERRFRREQQRDPLAFRRLPAAVALLNDSAAFAFYSTWGAGTRVAVLSVTASAVLKWRMGSLDYAIRTTNHPFPGEAIDRRNDKTAFLVWSLLIPMALSLWLTVFMVLHAEEMANGQKQLQFNAGASLETYWLSRYLWHMTVHTLMSLITAFVACVSDPNHYHWGLQEFGALLLLLIIFGVSGIPFAYLLCYIIPTEIGCYGVMFAFYVFGMIFFTANMTLSTVGGTVGAAMEAAEYALMLMPTYCIMVAFMQYRKAVFANHACELVGEAALKSQCALRPEVLCCTCKSEAGSCRTLPHYFTSGVKTAAAYLTFTFLLYFTLVLLLDNGWLQRVGRWCVVRAAHAHERRVRRKERRLRKGTGTAPGPLTEDALYRAWERDQDEAPPDSDVEAERRYVNSVFENYEDPEPYERRVKVSTVIQGDALLAHALVKRYNARTRAVRGLSFRVRCGECFGLLGLNGAGKSTTFGMLTAAHLPTEGDGVADFYRLNTNRLKFANQIGYCPQHNALIERLTGWELALLMARLRGVPEDDLVSEISKWMVLLDMESVMRDKCYTYSGGNKRKLNTVLALVGQPPILFLDEPTSGVDPTSRRRLWNALLATRRAGQSAVLTSHSMDECEALCDRLAIMVRGRLRCLGNIPHLKGKFRQGFTVRLKAQASAGPARMDALQAAVLQAFAKGRLLERHQAVMEFRVDDPSLTWSFLFGRMHALKQEHPALEDYTVSETTLEEIFLSMGERA